MAHEYLVMEIAGKPANDLYSELLSLEVELDDELAAMLRFKLPLMLQSDGTWQHLDDSRLVVWSDIKISAGFDQLEELISGYITHVKPHFGPDPAECSLEIWGMDRSVLMDREEKLQDWPNKKDSDIAMALFQRYGFTPQVEDTQVIHDETISTIIQRETDIRFLRRLALRNGYECYIEGSTGYFRSPQIGAPPQPTLAAHFGGETNLLKFDLEVDALAPANVAMCAVDRLTKQVLRTQASSSQQAVLGATASAGLLPGGMSPGLVYVGQSAATGNPEMTFLCQGLYHLGDWFVTAEGEITANEYAHVLRPRATVNIKGIGEAYSGTYYVSHVTHVFTSEGYIQRFRAKRNALMPTGTEVF